MNTKLKLAIEVSNKVKEYGTSPKAGWMFLDLINSFLNDEVAPIYPVFSFEVEFLAQLQVMFQSNHEIWNHVVLGIHPDEIREVEKYKRIFIEAYKLNFTKWATYDDALSLAKQLSIEV
jgi:hypothetical protein